jgi:hypothetical protein|tara:strand:+ start:1132 stop:1452 length:321 start_codon:yes stop_codon:yes gene_type:complete
MKLIKNLIILLSLSIALNGCSSFKEAGKVLRNEKVKTSDEFLIQKKEPLTQPPDFDKIPEPGSIQKSKESNQNNIEKILQKSRTKSSKNRTRSSSTEESILKQIKK